MSFIRHHREITYSVRKATYPGDHPDVEYHVSPMEEVGHDSTFITLQLKEAFCDAVLRAMSLGAPMWVDVVIWSQNGARFFAGDDGVERYQEDPEASVFERLEVSVNHVGKVP